MGADRSGRNERAHREAPLALGLASALSIALLALSLGLALREACVIFNVEGSGYFYCYSDIPPLYFARGLYAGTLPYLGAGLEYPVGTGLVAWLASALTSSVHGFFLANAVILTAAALAVVAVLAHLTGRRALYFGGSLTLVLWSFLNWDLLAVMLATAATAAFLARRDRLAGALIGLGAAVKIYPVLLLAPFVAQRLREGVRRGSIRMVTWAAIALAIPNALVAIVAFDGLTRFFRFNSARAPDWGTLWNVACDGLGFSICDRVALVNVLSLAVFIAGSVFVWFLVVPAAPDVPRWTLGFVLIVMFLLSNKVYSPQYSLWLLPWFALVLPDLRLFVAFEVVDVGIYATTWAWQARLGGEAGLPVWPLDLFVVLRACLLVAMLVVFVHRARAGELARLGGQARLFPGRANAR